MQDVKDKVSSNYIISKTLNKIETQEETNDYFNRIKYYISNFKELANENNTYTNNMLFKISEKIENTLIALEWKYKLITDTHKLSINPNKSGFPHFTELMKLRVESSKAEEVLDTLPELKSISHRFISEMLEKKIDSEYTKQLYSKRKYYEILLKNNCLEEFDVFLPETIDNKKYISWYNFDSSLNLPILYVMEFETDNHQENQNQFKEKVISILKSISNSNYTLYTIAKKIDNELDDVYPKRVSRHVIGPIYMKDYTDNDDIVQKILDIKGNLEQNILTWSEEFINSYDEEIESGFFKSIRRQKFYVDKTSKELNDGGLSGLNRFTLLTYNTYQKYNATGLYSIINYSKNHIISN